MTTTTNIQENGSTASEQIDNMTEKGTMNHKNNINMVSRFSKLIVGAAVGLALTIGVAMPGAANADLPAVSAPASVNFSSLNDDFSLVYGTPDVGSAPSVSAKLTGSTNFNGLNDDFSMVYGTPDVGSAPGVSAKLAGSTNFNGLNDDFSLVYGTPDAIA